MKALLICLIYAYSSLIILVLALFLLIKAEKMKEWFKKLNCCKGNKEETLIVTEKGNWLPYTLPCVGSMREGQTDSEYIVGQLQGARKELQEGCADLRKIISRGCEDLKRRNEEHGKKMNFCLDNLTRLIQNGPQVTEKNK